MEIYDFLKRLHDDCIAHAPKLIFNKRHPPDLYLVSLYGTLIELTGATVSLIDLGQRTGVPPLFRSFLDAFVEFKNLTKSANYVHYMEASYRNQWLKVFMEAKTLDNPYLQKIGEQSDIDGTIQEFRDSLEQLQEEGFHPLSIFERFEKAGLVKEYRSLYNFFSNDAHSNIRALISRHLDVEEDDFTVVFYKDGSLGDFLPIVDALSGMLLSAARDIHEKFDTTDKQFIVEAEKKLNDSRSPSVLDSAEQDG